MGPKTSFRLQAAAIVIVLPTLAFAPPVVGATVSFAAVITLIVAWSREP